jgi:hypothetical protein
VDLAVNTLTSFSSAGLSVPKYVADITLTAEHLVSIIPAAMTVREFIDVLYVQSLLKGLPDSFDSFKTSIRMAAALTPDQVRVRVLAEDAAMTATTSYSKVTRGAALKVGDKKCTAQGCWCRTFILDLKLGKKGVVRASRGAIAERLFLGQTLGFH